jgi:hypothetical protein
MGLQFRNEASLNGIGAVLAVNHPEYTLVKPQKSVVCQWGSRAHLCFIKQIQGATWFDIDLQ